MTRADLHHAIGWAAWYRLRQRDLDRRRCLLRALEIRRYLRDTSPPPSTPADPRATRSPAPAPDTAPEPSAGVDSGARPPLPPVAPGHPELVARLLEPQPLPVGDGDSVTDAALEAVTDPRVRELLRARREQGIARYGRELTATNGRDARGDAVQEAADLCLYLFQLHMEKRHHTAKIDAVSVAELIGELMDGITPCSACAHGVIDDPSTEWMCRACQLSTPPHALPHELPSMPVGGGT